MLVMCSYVLFLLMALFAGISLCRRSDLHWLARLNAIILVPVHRTVFRGFFARPRRLQWYLLVAIVSVLFTYFGANYLLPGLHSYA